MCKDDSPTAFGRVHRDGRVRGKFVQHGHFWAWVAGGKLAVNRRNFLAGAAAAGTITSAAARAAAADPPRAGGGPKGPLKITEVRVYLHPVAHLHPVMVQVLTDGGISGVGEAALAYGTGGTAAAGMIK